MFKNLYKKRGQILLEILWLLFFTSVFLIMVSHLYNNGIQEISLSRLK